MRRVSSCPFPPPNEKAPRLRGFVLRSVARDGLRLLLLVCLPASVARETRDLPALRDLHRAVLELRDLAERVEGGVGEAVGSGFVEGERDEDRAARRAFV